MKINSPQGLYDFLKEKGVTRLCHFTKVKNFVHILTSSDGIVATKFIKADIREQNDLNRCDGELDYVCCSIEYPNSWYWEKVKSRDNDFVFREWVIICVDLEIVKNRKIKYSVCNAALCNGRYIKEELSFFEDMYAPKLQICKRSLERTSNMLTCCPTDDQAEILIHYNIPIKYIKAVIVGNEDTADNINAILKMYKMDLDIFIAPSICDKSWSSMVRNGIRPTEEKFNRD